MPETPNLWQKSHPWEPSPHAFPEPVPIVSQADLINPLLHAADLMDHDFEVCSPETPLLDAVRRLTRCESGIMPVIEDNNEGKPVGVLTEREVVAALAISQREALRLPVRDVMSTKFQTVKLNDPLDKLFKHFGPRGVMVVDSKHKLRGMIHWRGLAKGCSERGIGRILLGLFKRRH
ncbi:MAG TPA: CBS domain-containing protein [Pirellulales bacterium]